MAEISVTRAPRRAAHSARVQAAGTGSDDDHLGVSGPRPRPVRYWRWPATPVLLSHPSSLDHDPGPHPEQPARIVAIERALAGREWLGFRRLESPAVDRAVLEAVHPAAYVSVIERLCGAGRGPDRRRHGDERRLVRGRAARRGRCGAGSPSCSSAGEAPTGFSAHRPPGHHARTAQAMGFCLFNNVAVAARHAVDRLGCGG